MAATISAIIGGITAAATAVGSAIATGAGVLGSTLGAIGGTVGSGLGIGTGAGLGTGLGGTIGGLAAGGLGGGGGMLGALGTGLSTLAGAAPGIIGAVAPGVMGGGKPPASTPLPGIGGSGGAAAPVGLGPLSAMMYPLGARAAAPGAAPIYGTGPATTGSNSPINYTDVQPGIDYTDTNASALPPTANPIGPSSAFWKDLGTLLKSGGAALNAGAQRDYLNRLQNRGYTVTPQGFTGNYSFGNDVLNSLRSGAY